MDFNQSKDNYRQTIERSIAFAGKGLDFFTEVKADYLRRIVARRLGGVTEPRILDIGCGHGLLHSYLRSFGLDIVGTEVATEVLSLARAANPKVAYVGYDGQTLPFSPNSFDLALAVCVMHHVPPAQWKDFLREMRRVLRPGGIAVIFEHNPLNPLTRYVVASNTIDADANLLSARMLRKLMRYAGFDGPQTRNIIFTPFAHPGFRWLDDHLGRIPFGAQYYAIGTNNS
jgi:SAM-dependent methyltransferase